MTRRYFAISTLAAALRGQSRTLQPDVAKLAESNAFTLLTCKAGVLREAGKNGVRLENACVAFIPSVEFANGVIEVDLRGKDLQGQSFLGVAFHGADGTNYDAVYFRPFNFRAEDPMRRAHAVQYVSHPDYPWNRLRDEQPGKYEQAVAPVPDPNGWFHARIVIASPKVSVFVEDARQPSLVVSQLSRRGKGIVGLWGGGDFANLKLTPA